MATLRGGSCVADMSPLARGNGMMNCAVGFTGDGPVIVCGNGSNTSNISNGAPIVKIGGSASSVCC